MGIIDVVKILGYGVIGLGFLLAFMAYRLLSEEQKKPRPTDKMLKAIREYMYFSIAITILGGAFLMVDKFVPVLASRNGESQPGPTPTLTPTPSPPQVKVELSEDIGNVLRDVELVDGAAKIVVTGNSQGVFGTNATVFACSQYDEIEWWCRRADVRRDGTWSANLYPKGPNPPFKDESEVRLMAIVKSVDNSLPNSKGNEEYPESDIDRFTVKSSRKNVKIYLKNN